MPQTSGKGYEIPGTGTLTDTWGDTFNSNVIDYVDVNMGEQVSKTLSSSDVTLTAAEARAAYLSLGGTVTQPITITSANQGFYIVGNGCTGSPITLTNGVAGGVLPNLRRMLVFADPNSGVRIVAISDVGAGLTNQAYDPIPAGTRMLFYQAAVPTGWTVVTTWDDYGLVISNTAGGVAAGTTAWSTVFGVTATDSHVVLEVEMPVHTHTLTLLNTGTSGSPDGIAHFSERTVLVFTGVGQHTSNTGSTAGHTHPFDLRVQTASILLGERNAN